MGLQRVRIEQLSFHLDWAEQTLSSTWEAALLNQFLFASQLSRRQGNFLKASFQWEKTKIMENKNFGRNLFSRKNVCIDAALSSLTIVCVCVCVCVCAASGRSLIYKYLKSIKFLLKKENDIFPFSALILPLVCWQLAAWLLQSNAPRSRFTVWALQAFVSS